MFFTGAHELNNSTHKIKNNDRVDLLEDINLQFNYLKGLMFEKYSVQRSAFNVPSSAFNVPRSALRVRIHVPLCVPRSMLRVTRYGFVFRFCIPGSVFCVLRFGF